MLATPIAYPQRVTLIPNSGSNFWTSPLRRYWMPSALANLLRQTANGPLLRLNYHQAKDRYFLPIAPGEPAEMVRPEFSFPLEQSLRLLDRVWLPLPFLRFNPPNSFLSGPDNWVRMQIRRLD